MKYFKKLISLCVMLVLVVGLVGCGGKSPSQVVSDSLDTIKNRENNDFSSALNDYILKKNNVEIGEATKLMVDCLYSITYKINSEKKDGNTATVNVSVYGPDFEEVINKFMEDALTELLSEKLSGQKLSEEKRREKLKKILTDILDTTNLTERTMDIDLIKENNEWKIKDQKQLVKLVVNLDEDSLGGLFK